MTRFGHKLNYVINTFVKHTPAHSIYRACGKLLSVYVFSSFPFGFEGRIRDLIVSVLDHCLSFYFVCQKMC